MTELSIIGSAAIGASIIGAESIGAAIVGAEPIGAMLEGVPQPQGQLSSTTGVATIGVVVPQQSTGAGVQLGAGGGQAGAQETEQGSGVT